MSAAAAMKPYLTKSEAAEFLSWDAKTLEGKMRSGVLRRGVHWFKREGEIGPRFKTDALVAFIECRDREAAEAVPLRQLARGDNVLTLRRGRR